MLFVLQTDFGEIALNWFSMHLARFGSRLAQAATMADIKSNLLCNITATGASDGTGRCFYDRLAQLVEPCIIRTEWDDNANGDCHIYNTKRQ